MTLTFPSSKMLMMGGASLAVLTIAVISTQQQPRTLGPIDTVISSKQEAPVLVEQAPMETADAADISGGAAGNLAPPAPPAPQRAEAPAAEPAVVGASSTVQPAKPLTKGARLGGLSSTETESRLRRTPVELDRMMVRDDEQPLAQSDQAREQFEAITPNPVKLTAEDPVSTFSIDVDTASYGVMRSSLMNGVLPPKDAVRIEELVNYFPYDYQPPETGDVPFASHISVMPTPWNSGTQLMHIGIKGYEITQAERPRANLVFLLDTSGSMNEPNKLPLLKNAFRMLVQSLDDNDTVSIVVYAGSAGTVLEPTKVRDRAKILTALDRLSAGGSTAGGEGIRQAYKLAEAGFDKDGVNRIVLATDGDFNVGISDPEALKGFVERKRESGVFLSVLGFGRGNYNDALMQTLAQNGNGTAAYIDTLSEARKVLVEESGSTLFPIAKDVKIQVEFNPSTVSEYRLIGYETRLLNREDFNNDRIDAGEIGSGHSVTALYEITPAGSPAARIDPLRYGQAADTTDAQSGEYGFLKIRYKAPDSDTSELIETAVTPADEVDLQGTPATEARFATSVAAFGQVLRGGRQTGAFSYDDIIALANSAKGDDPFGYRAEFVNLVRLAKTATALAPQ